LSACSAWSALRAQRAPELGQRRGAIAQQCLERPRPVAVANQGEPERALRAPALLEQLRFHAIGPREPLGGHGDAPGEDGPERADRRQLLDKNRLERFELGGILVRQHDLLLRAHAVLQRVLRRTRLAFGRLRAARLRPVLPARFGAGIAELDGRARRGSCTRHDGFLADGIC
jgi:hypothetical protein